DDVRCRTGSSEIARRSHCWGGKVRCRTGSSDRELMLFPIPLRLTARWLVLLVIGLNIMSAFRPGGTSVATHFGGLGVGYAYMKLIPWWRALRRRQRGESKSGNDPMDVVGEAVDNIFSYEKEKRRRK
ncbi:MAG: rhomboid family intramembrane serine protease, partial [Candidatus Hydrogenedentota bacterium]